MDNCNKNIPSELHNKICGVIFGQAIGDALGLGAEFMSHKEVLKYYPQGLTLYNQIIQDYHRKRWKQGDWTDDTDMIDYKLNRELGRMEQERKDNESKAYHNRRKRNPSKG